MNARFFSFLSALAVFTATGCGGSDNLSGVPQFSPNPGDSSITEAYVANYDGGTVSIITLADLTVRATVDVGDLPVDVTMSPDQSLSLVPNAGSNSISVIDNDSATEIDTVATGTYPEAVVYAPDGLTFWVTNFGSAEVRVYDAATFSETAAIEVSAGPRSLAFTFDGLKVFVACFTAGTVDVIDVASQTATDSIAVGGQALSIAMNGNGTQALVALYDQGSAALIDVQSRTVLDTIEVGSGPDEVSYDSFSFSYYLTNRNDGSMSRVDAFALQVTTLEIQDGVISYAFTPNRATLYMSNHDTGNLLQINTATGEILAEIPVGAGPIGVALR